MLLSVDCSWPWKWWRHVPPKFSELPPRPHSITIHKTTTDIFTAAVTSRMKQTSSNSVYQPVCGDRNLSARQFQSKYTSTNIWQMLTKCGGSHRYRLQLNLLFTHCDFFFGIAIFNEWQLLCFWQWSGTMNCAGCLCLLEEGRKTSVHAARMWLAGSVQTTVTNTAVINYYPTYQPYH